MPLIHIERIAGKEEVEVEGATVEGEGGVEGLMDEIEWGERRIRGERIGLEEKEEEKSVTGGGGGKKREKDDEEKKRMKRKGSRRKEESPTRKGWRWRELP